MPKIADQYVQTTVLFNQRIDQRIGSGPIGHVCVDPFAAKLGCRQGSTDFGAPSSVVAVPTTLAPWRASPV